MTRVINKIILHCTDSDSVAHDVAALYYLRKWHVDERQWKDIGYHFCISKANGLQFCRPMQIIGAHTQFENDDSIGIVLTGSKVFSNAQLEELVKLCAVLCFSFNLIAEVIYPHSHFNKTKTCPNFDVEKVKERVSLILNNKKESNGIG